MIKLSLNLPIYRLNLQLVKRQGASLEKIVLLKLSELRNIRSGDKISRLFRYIFEHKNIKKIFGTNLALMVFLGSFIPAKADFSQAEQTVIQETNSPVTIDTKNIIQFPLVSFYISQGFSLFHPAIDLAATYGDEVKPIKDGVVEDIYRVGFLNYGYGNTILIDHGNGISSLYAHLSQIDVARGDKVTVFSKIGEVGETGNASGPHVHLEIRNHGISINPFAILPSSTSAI